MIIMSKEGRERMIKAIVGRKVASLEYETPENNPQTGGYWVMTFAPEEGSESCCTGDTEISFRFMAEIV